MKLGLTHFFSPSLNALRWGFVDKLQRSEKKGILRKPWRCLMFSNEKNLLPLLILFCIFAFALSACEQLDWVLNSLVGWDDDTPASCELEAFVVTTNLDIYNNSACNEAHCSLREAIQAANECEGPDTITLPGNFYSMFATGTGVSNDRGDFNISDDIVISGDGIGNTIIDAPLWWRDRIFMIEEGIQVEIHDLTIKGANIRAGNGGGIHNLGNLILRNVKLEKNKAERGGGLYNAGNATLVSVQITENIAKIEPDSHGASVITHGNPTDDCGGGITNAGSLTIGDSSYIGLNEAIIGSGICNTNGGDLTITSSWIDKNSPLTPELTTTTFIGGGIANFSILTIEDTQITENNANFGGGIFSSPSSGIEMRLSGVLFENNKAIQGPRPFGWPTALYSGGAGGGLYLSGGNISITNTEIRRNTARNGGGLHFSLPGAGTVGTISNSAIINNQAEMGGAALSHYGGADRSLLITNVTIAEHDVAIYVDSGENAIWLTNVTLGRNRIAIQAHDGRIFIRNTLIAGNTGTSCFLETFSQISSGGFNIVDDHDLSCLDSRTSSDGDLVYVDLGSILLGPGLTSRDGGSTPYYPLLPGSVAIDVIDPTVSTCPPDDQRGVARPIPDGGLCDVGAYEAPPIVPLRGQVDPGDFDDIVTVTPPPESSLPSVPAFTFTTDANCRQGPGTAYEIDASFLQGQTAQIDGRNQTAPLWWRVLRSNGGHCWVSDTTGTSSGPTDSVQVVAAAPPPPVVIPPTDTPIPPPPQTAPSAPYKLNIQDHVCAGSTYTVTLAWGDTANNETGFRIYRDNVVIATLGANAISYTDSPPGSGPYYYVVEAYNNAGSSQSSSAKDDGCIF